jgi:hypothetical protein
MVFHFSKRMRSGTVVDGCIKENETDCVRLVVLYGKMNETVRKEKL